MLLFQKPGLIQKLYTFRFWLVILISLITNNKKMTSSGKMSTTQKLEFKNYLRKFIYGESNGYEMIQAFESIPNLQQKLAIGDLLEKRKHPNLTPKQQMQINARRLTETFKLAKQSKNPQLVFRNPDNILENYGFILNTGAFLVTIELLGNQHQVKNWRQLVLKGKVIGGYGQTELGHGSNVQMLQTQAVYDEERGTFIINTPKNTATKFWPGIFGLYSTHCVLQAKTTVKGKSIGVQTFILPMRDQNLNLLPGIEAGDIGPKLGFIRIDNGFLKINNVQIPRENMLSRYIQIQENGQVLGLENKQAIKYGYGSMLNLRIKLVIGFALAYTYLPGIIQWQICELSNKINDELVKKRLIEIICTGLGTVFSNVYAVSIFKQFISALQQKDYNKADKFLVQGHIISSTFKAISSWKCEEILRQTVTMNQFGSFQSTYLPKFFTDCIPSVTYEGDNTVLLQQTAKFILMKEKQDELIKPNQNVNSNNLSELLAVFKYVASSEIRNLKGIIQNSIGKGNDFNIVWNELYQSQIIEVSKVWGRMMLLFTSIETLKTVTQHKQFFQKLIKVYASTLIQQTKQIQFYGFKFTEFTAWKDFTADELEVLRDLNRPVPRDYQPHNYETRGSKDVADWIYSRL